MKLFHLKIFIFLFFLSLPVFSQDYHDIQGVWQGDRGLGNVYLFADGTGYLTFTHNTNLQMAINVQVENNQFFIEQAEPNRWEFYTYALPEDVAKQVESIISPMRWELRLNSHGNKLEGRKHTSTVEWDSDTLALSNLDNQVERNALWIRQEGNVHIAFKPQAAEDNELHIELFSVVKQGDRLIVQYNVTNLDHKEREYNIYQSGHRLVDQNGRIWSDVEYVVVDSDRGSTWAGTIMEEGVPVFNEISFINIPRGLEEIRVLEISGNLFSVQFRNVPFLNEE